MPIFEIRLPGDGPSSTLFFVTSRTSADMAVEQARRLLERHPEFHAAEIWKGMALVADLTNQRMTGPGTAGRDLT